MAHFGPTSTTVPRRPTLDTCLKLFEKKDEKKSQTVEIVDVAIEALRLENVIDDQKEEMAQMRSTIKQAMAKLQEQQAEIARLRQFCHDSDKEPDNIYFVRDSTTSRFYMLKKHRTPYALHR